VENCGKDPENMHFYFNKYGSIDKRKQKKNIIIKYNIANEKKTNAN